MKILDFGNPARSKLILIHGFQCPWQIWEEHINHFRSRFLGKMLCRQYLRLSDSLASTGIEIHYFHGGAWSECFFRKVAAHLKKKLICANVTVFRGKGHYEDALLHPQVRIRVLEKILCPDRQ